MRGATLMPPRPRRGEDAADVGRDARTNDRRVARAAGPAGQVGVFPAPPCRSAAAGPQEAQAIAAAAARHGATLEPSDIATAWYAVTEGWLHERATFAALRVCEDVYPEDGDYLFATLETGRPPEAFRAAAALVPDLADYERARNEAVASAPAPGTPEGAVWDRQWPAPEAKFADRLAPIVGDFKRAHAL